MTQVRYCVRFADGSRSDLFAEHHDASALARRTGGTVKSRVAVYGYD